MTDTAWAILVGAVCNVSCALVGCYLVLRRLSLLGDAISHAVLPGIVLAFLLSGQLTGWPIVLGAMVLGVLTAMLTQAVHEVGNVPEDSSMGVVFTSLFAAGVVLIERFARGRDLDVDCVLHGQLETVAGNTELVFGMEVPVALWTMAPVLLLVIAFVLLLWKELKVAAFDAELATSLGINATLIHYLLMAMVAGVTVTSFEAVGAILVVAMLVVPAATAHLLTDRLAWMLVWAAAVAVVSAVAGYLAARWLDTNAASLMAVAAGLQFVLAVVFAPRHGVISKLIHKWRLSLRIACEDVLGVLYRREEAARQGQPLRPLRLPAGLAGRLAMPYLTWRRQVEQAADGSTRLTDKGRRRAESLVRGHRLWEAYLQEHLGLPADHVHEPAERMEHYLDPQLQQELAAEVHRTDVDPHGRTIPPGPG